MLTCHSDTENVSASSGAPCLLEKTKGISQGKVVSANKLTQVGTLKSFKKYS